MTKYPLKPRTRRNFLKMAGMTAAALRISGARSATEKKVMTLDESPSSQMPSRDNRTITLFFCGDVMTGRGIDQVLPHPGKPWIYESFMKSAESYVKLAEDVNGPVPKPVDFAYIWGDALE